jgi:predicted GIY-YIG superfamily endonuclease
VRYVYILRSIKNPVKTYVGMTENLKRRLQDHNSGRTAHTSLFCSWKLETYIAFSCEEKAKRFEKYLKHGSGHAFRKRYF